jgi:hypothetical protein
MLMCVYCVMCWTGNNHGTISDGIDSIVVSKSGSQTVAVGHNSPGLQFKNKVTWRLWSRDFSLL